MSTKESVLYKIQILITNHFETPEGAFKFFDKNSDGKLNTREIAKLLKEAEINGFIRGIISRKLIDGYDKSGDEYVDWHEFKAAIDEIADDSK